MILKIDTKDQKTIKVSIKKDGGVVSEMTSENEYGSQALLPLIEKLLKKNKMEFKDLKEVEVEIGPGSFTGLRVGVSVANALGYSLNIPVNGKKIETDIQY